MQQRLDRILETEQEAAAALVRRTTTFRERLLDAEDGLETVTVTMASGTTVQGVLEAVCPDHLEVRGLHRTALVVLEQVAVVEFP